MDLKQLVSSDWLQQHLNDVVVIDGSHYMASMAKDPDAEFEKSHIPNAQRWNIDLIADLPGDLKHMMPPPERVASEAGARGIDRDTAVVIYDQLGMFSAARVWLTFKTLGHNRVALLDGGLPAWGGELQTGTASPVSAVEYGDYNTHLKTVGRQQVLAALNSSTVSILDARSAGRFAGTAAEPVAGLKSGHMPSAFNIPYTELLDSNNRFKSVAELGEVFQRNGVDFERQLITSCGSGVTASIISFALAMLGKDSLVYDGSWSEWGQVALNLPVVTEQ